jgi:uncharacterized protein involved in type VI secretion and phage assembly
MMNVVSDERYFGVYQAIVADGVDPLGLGRVRVSVPIVDPNDTLWAIVVVPSTGQEAAVLPAVGTDVVVAFEAGDRERPYVLGSVWR